MASLVLAGAGSVIGGAIGGPWGARIGWAVGAAVGNRIGQRGQTLRGPRLNDTRIQASTWGERIPVVYGTYRLSCNLIWSAGIREVVTRTRNRGKGGPSSTTETYTYFVDAAFGICEGPIVGIRRIWANGQLIYNAGTNADVATLIESNQVSTQFTLYTGTETQTPSSVIEGYKGAGNVPGYRGLAYIVFQNFALAPYGNALPNFEFEVVTSGAISQSGWVPSASVTAGAVTGMFVKKDFTRLFLIRANLGIHFSDNQAVSWSSAVIPPGASQVTDGFHVGGNVFILTSGSPANTVWRSVDNGVSWASVTTAASSGWSRGVANADGSICVIFDGNGVSRSLDGGATWQPKINFPAPINVGQAVWVVDRFFFLTTVAGGNSYWSTDGATFNAVAVPASSGIPPTRIAVLGDWLVACMSTGAGTASYVESRDRGLNWTIRSMPSVQNYFDVTASDDRFLMISSNGTVAYWSLTGDGGWNSTTLALVRIANRVRFSFPYFVALHSQFEVDSQRITFYQTISANNVLVASIAADQFARSGLTIGQYNTAGVTDLVTGYAVTRIASARDNIEPLQSAFFFDVVESGAELKLVKRGGSLAATIPDDDLGAHPFGADAPASVAITRSQEVDLPTRVVIRYANANGDYLPATEQSRRIAGQSRQEAVIELPIALTPDQAAKIADITMYNAYIARTRYAFSTSIKYAKYEPGDILGLPLDSGIARVRVVRKEESGPQINFEGVGDDALVYQSDVVGGTQQVSQSQIVLPALTDFLAMDIPIVRDQDNDASFYAVLTPAVENDTWRGAELYQSPDGVDFELSGQVFQTAAVGTCSTTLPDWAGGNIPDETSTLEVVLTSGTLDTITFSQFLNGGMVCLVGEELIFARVATLTAPATYTLSGLLRGRFGTEQHIATHAASERFVRLSTAGTLRPPLEPADIGVEYLYRAVSIGRRFDTAPSIGVTCSAVGLLPYSATGIRGGKQDNGDFLIEWFRRGRIDAGWRSGVDVPIGEASESYQVDIMAGSAVVRTLFATSPTVTYTDAMQVADFGSAQASVDLVIYQMSATVGRGFPAEATLT